jgi:bacterial leucyl aminopeptidase
MKLISFLMFLYSSFIFAQQEKLYLNDGNNFFKLQEKQVYSSSYELAKQKNLLIWQDAKKFISFKNNRIKNIFYLLYGKENLFSIEYDLNSNFAKDLKKDLNTKMMFKSYLKNIALIVIKDLNYLNNLARKAHSGKVNACGKIVKLSIAQSVPEYTRFSAPIYDENVKLSKVNDLLPTMNSSDIIDFVTQLGTFSTRGHSSTEGKQVPEFILNKAKSLPGKHSNIEYLSKSVDDLRVDQNNVVIRIKGEDPNDKNLVIVGAHIDTIVSGNISGANKGSDDDASGVAVWFSVLKKILENNLKFKRTVEFHGYAAEEVGLLGSSDLARKYRLSNKKVAAMLQLDMTLYSSAKDSETIYLVRNNTDRVLRRSLKNLLNTYLGGNFESKSLRSGNSDHSSWYSNYYPAVFPFEDPHHYNPHIHTPYDNLTNASNKKLALRFSKLVLIYLSHHAGIVSAESKYKQVNLNCLDSSKKTICNNDLKVAITKGKSNNKWNISIATKTFIKKVEVCLSHSYQEYPCKYGLVDMIKAKTSDSRSFFINSLENEFLLKPEETLTVFGYDSKDKLSLRRSVSITAK